MAFDWEDYLKYAKSKEGNADECIIRSAISRSYYAAFNYASDYIVKNKIRLDPALGSHEQIWKALQGLKDINLKKVGKDGFSIKNMRVYADYDKYYNIKPEELKNINFYVDNIIKTIKKF